ncbi:MAG TPA: hypothetical protein VG406_10765 [Isosphaeraceae bacterium]|jgi:hypothetical protein|nr:hypothetical protein [Isosphaeraceae bacterium]
MVPTTIPRLLGRLRRRERRLRLAWGLARWLAIVAVALAAACLADWIIDLRRETPYSLRVGMLMAQVVLAIAAGWNLVVAPRLGRVDDEALARWVEGREPRLAHRLVAALQFNRPDADTRGMSPDLIEHVTRATDADAAGLEPGQLLDGRRYDRALMLAAAIVLLAGLVADRRPATTRALLARQALADVEIPRSLRLEGIGPRVGVAGEEVVVRVRASGPGVRDRLRGRLRIEPDEGPAVEVALARESAAVFAARVPLSRSSFRFRAWLGDGRLKWPGRVRVEPRPAVARLDATLVLPSYCGTKPDGRPFERPAPNGDVAGPTGASARVVVAAQKPIAGGTIELLGRDRAAVVRRVSLTASQDGRRANGAFDLRDGEAAYRVRVVDRDGLANVDPPRRGVALIADEPPRVTMLPEHLDPDADPDEPEEIHEPIPVPVGGVVRVEYACRDSFGLGRARLAYRVDGGAWSHLPLEEGPPSAVAEFFADPSPDPWRRPGRLDGGGRVDFQTRSIPGLKAGDRLEFAVEVFDANPDPARPPGRSEPRVKVVVTPSRFIDWALARLGHEARLRGLESGQLAVFDAADAPPESVASISPAPPLGAFGKARARTGDSKNAFIRTWQLIGPFPNRDDKGLEARYGPEEGPVDLAREFDGRDGKVRWRACPGDADQIDLARILGGESAAVYYAVCWVRPLGPSHARLAVGSDDGVKVWLNRKLLFVDHSHRPIAPAQDVRRVDLEPGWNELLVKVDNGSGPSLFCCELEETLFDRPLRGLEVRVTPPGRE